MKTHAPTIDLEQKQRVTSRFPRSTNHRKDKIERPGSVAFQLYGIGGHKKTHPSGASHLYGVEEGKVKPFQLYGTSGHKQEYQSGLFGLYGVGKCQTD